MITITDKAANQILQKSNYMNNYGLRIRVVGGGCTGLRYDMSIDNCTKSKDMVFMHNYAQVVVDKKSFLYLKGSVIDYEEGLMSSGFRINNPNVSRTCGCGESFDVKDISTNNEG